MTIIEDMDEDDDYDPVLMDIVNTMSHNPRFRERRFYIEGNRLHLFDGETHHYVGSTYYDDPSVIVGYMYQNVYRQLFPVSRGGKRRKTLKKEKRKKKL